MVNNRLNVKVENQVTNPKLDLGIEVETDNWA